MFFLTSDSSLVTPEIVPVLLPTSNCWSGNFYQSFTFPSSDGILSLNLMSRSATPLVCSHNQDFPGRPPKSVLKHHWKLKSYIAVEMKIGFRPTVVNNTFEQNLLEKIK